MSSRSEIPRQNTYYARPNLTAGGCGLVEIRQRLPSTVPDTMFRIFQPNRNNPPIVFTQVIEQHLVLTVDAAATVTLVDFIKQEQVAIRKLGGVSGAAAVLSDDNLFVALETDRGGESCKELFLIDSSDLTVRKRWDLPEKSITDRLTVLNREQVVIYFSAGGLFRGRSNDGLIRLDGRSDEETVIFLPNPPSGLYPAPPVLICPDRNIGIRPDYGRIEIKNRHSEKRYLAKLLVFSLDSGRTVRTFIAREFRPEHVFEDENPQFALSLLQLPQTSDDYREARDEFLERFDALIRSPGEDAFWVSFHHGLIRKLSFEGKTLTGLIAHPGYAGQVPGNDYHRTGFETPMTISCDGQTLRFGDPPAAFRLADIASVGETELTVLPKHHLNLAGETTGIKRLNDFSWITVSLEASLSEGSLLAAMNALERISQDVENNRDGLMFRVRFCDQGSYLTEKAVFPRLVNFPWSQPLIGQYVRNLCRYGKPLWYNATIPAGLWAVRSLVLIDKTYLGVLNDYLSSGLIDPKEEYDEPGRLIDEVIYRYGFDREAITLLLTRAYFQPEKGLDQLLAWMEKPELQQYLDTPSHKTGFRTHHLFRTLSEDYFHLLLPDENAIFEAIESENADLVAELIDKKTDLNIKHPDYDCYPLDLALEADNPIIVGLLRENGARGQSNPDETLAGISDIEKLDGGDALMAEVRLSLNYLRKRKKYIEETIAKIEFDELVNRSLDEFQAERLKELSGHLKAVSEKIKALQLKSRGSGLNRDLSSRVGSSDTDDQAHLPECDAAAYYYFDEELESVHIVVSRFDGSDSGIEAIDLMTEMAAKINTDRVDMLLRIFVTDGLSERDEKSFFQKLTITSEIATSVQQYVQTIMQLKITAWSDEDAQIGLYPLWALIRYDCAYIEDLLTFLRSGLIDDELEQSVLTEMIFDILERYGWSQETLGLLVTRVLTSESQTALDEFRLQFKKGGLKEYLQEESVLRQFNEMLAGETDVSETKAQRIMALRKIVSVR